MGLTPFDHKRLSPLELIVDCIMTKGSVHVCVHVKGGGSIMGPSFNRFGVLAKLTRIQDIWFLMAVTMITLLAKYHSFRSAATAMVESSIGEDSNSEGRN